jgi:hypothetical protein
MQEPLRAVASLVLGLPLFAGPTHAAQTHSEHRPQHEGQHSQQQHEGRDASHGDREIPSLFMGAAPTRGSGCT